MSKLDGGPAFPFTSKWVSRDGETTGPHLGMSIQDYAEIHFTAAWLSVLGHPSRGLTTTQVHNDSCRWGRIQANAMLKAQAE